MKTIETHRRVNDILLGPLERTALRWLAARMPAWVTPDVLTAVGVLGAFVTSAGYILSASDRNFLWLASFGFLVNWFGDSLDGTLARYRQIERPRYGFYIDHVSDTFCQSIVFLGLGLSPYVSFEVASVTLIAFLMLTILVHIRTSVAGEFKISYGKLGPTEMRAFAILLNTAMFFSGPGTIEWFFGGNPFSVSVYDLGVSLMALLMLAFFFYTAWKQALVLSKLGE